MAKGDTLAKVGQGEAQPRSRGHCPATWLCGGLHPAVHFPPVPLLGPSSSPTSDRSSAPLLVLVFLLFF